MEPGNGTGDLRLGRGRSGEAWARRHLRDQGYEIIESNYRSRYGEIDIIATRDDIVAFVEVKARRALSHGEPFEAVGPRKQLQIRRMAEMWVAQRQQDPSLRRCSFRFDVISILLDEDGRVASLDHLEDAFR